MHPTIRCGEFSEKARARFRLRSSIVRSILVFLEGLTDRVFRFPFVFFKPDEDVAFL